ncbi:calcium/sodium antiporter [Micromonospora sp. MS34]|uniref:calcium/sodium antiporter n=1 Tax=Micromonospora sp. MS34 TaxID=3385971 RepID=UPI00399FB154
MSAFALIAAGLVALLLGAELVVRGGSELAGRLGVSPMIIGLTVVSIGTSAPELAIGVEAALDGVGELAVGNVAGTNVVNLLLILGLSALLRPLPLPAQAMRLDLPATAVAAVVLLLMALDGTLSHLDGVFLLLVGLGYTVVIVQVARRGRDGARRRGSPSGGSSVLVATLAAVALSTGIGSVVVGADWLVHGATGVARQLGVSDAVLGLTVVAVGTSAPELVTTLVATFRNHRDLAVGNLVGSSFYNIALILGTTAVAAPGGLRLPAPLVRVDLSVMTGVVLACMPVFLRGRRLTRVEGALLVLAYSGYLAYLVLART